MKIYFRHLLEKLANISGAPAPVCTVIAKETGIPLMRVNKLLGHPSITVRKDELNSLVTFLVSRWRPWIAPSVSDRQLTDQLRFEMLAFEVAPKANSSEQTIEPGKGTLGDLSLD